MTAGQAARDLSQRFTAAGIDTGRLDARLLLAQVLGIEPMQVLTRPDMVLTAEQHARLEALAARREAREPMSHILGRRGFWTLDLAVTADTLDPRGDTETLIETVLAHIPDRQAPLNILDFGTGTGAILLALLSELPNAHGVGVDKSEAALLVARRNAEINHLDRRCRFLLGDWGRGLDERFHVIVSNPPYIPDQDIDGLEPEVARYEPRLALAGGADGLDCYRALVPEMARLLVSGGLAGFEFGQGQAEDVGALMKDSGFTIRAVARDLGGVERCVVAVLSEKPPHS